MTEEEAANLRPGQRVSYGGLRDDDDNPIKEYGVVVRIWFDPEIGCLDTHVAFFGEEWPGEGPSKEQPYVLRYAAVSLVLEPDADS